MIKMALCNYCENYIGLKDGWKRACKAYPEGMPCDYLGSREKCNGDYCYKEKSTIPPKIKEKMERIA